MPHADRDTDAGLATCSGDETAPYALIVDPRRWTPIATVPCPSFRGWRYLESPPDGAPEGAKRDADQTSTGSEIQ